LQFARLLRGLRIETIKLLPPTTINIGVLVTREGEGFVKMKEKKNTRRNRLPEELQQKHESGR